MGKVNSPKWTRKSLLSPKGGSPMAGNKSFGAKSQLRPTNGMSNLGKPSKGGAPMKGNKGPVKG